MKDKVGTHRVVTFLTREEMEFMDKLEKDMMFSTGRSISRSKMLEDLAKILENTGMNASGINSNEELKQRMLEAIAEFAKANPLKS